MAGATYLRPNGMGAVRRIMPRRSRLAPVATSCISSSTPSATFARSAIARPSWVMRRLRVFRSNRVAPSACSSRAICLLTVLGARCRARAAAEKLRHSTTCTNTAGSSRLRKVIWYDSGKVFVDYGHLYGRSASLEWRSKPACRSKYWSLATRRFPRRSSSPAPASPFSWGCWLMRIARGPARHRVRHIGEGGHRFCNTGAPNHATPFVRPDPP